MSKSSCSGCGSTLNLYGSNCKHMTLCFTCGKTMAEKQGKCSQCGTIVTRLVREYNVRANPNSTDKNYFIGRFRTGLPDFSKEKCAENKWSLQKEGRRQLAADAISREKIKNKPWVLEEESGQSQYQGNFEGSQSSANYFLLVMQGKEFVAIPAGSWYNFNKVAQYKQLTLEEAENKIKNWEKKKEDGFGRWIMKLAPNNNAVAVGKVKIEDKDGSANTAAAGGSWREIPTGEEDVDMDDDDEIEKGNDREHDEIFTDDDEAIDDPEERDLAEEVPLPPEIFMEKDEDEEGDEEKDGYGLSESEKELKKLLGRGLNELLNPDDDLTLINPVLAPPKPAPSKEEAPNPDNTNGKRKANVGGGDDDTNNAAAPVKKVKSSEPESKSSVKKPMVSKGTPSSSAAKAGPVTEEEIRSFLLRKAPVTTRDIADEYKARLKSSEDKKGVADILMRIAKIQKTNGPDKYVVLREKVIG